MSQLVTTRPNNVGAIVRYAYRSYRRRAAGKQAAPAFFLVLGVAGILLTFLLALIFSSVETPVSMLDWLILSLFIFYNSPLVKAEIDHAKSFHARIRLSDHLRLLLFIALDNNPFLFCAPLYILLNFFLRLDAPSGLTELFFAVLLLLVFLLAFIFDLLLLSFWGYAGLLLSLLKLLSYRPGAWLPGLYAALTVPVFLLTFKYGRHAVYQTFSATAGLPARRKPLRYLVLLSRKKKAQLLFSILLTFCAAFFSGGPHAMEALLFLTIFNSELLLDTAFKNLRTNCNRFNFLYLSPASFLERFLLSDEYYFGFYTLFIGAAVILLVKNVSPLKGLSFLVSFSTVSLLYYALREKMFLLKRKVNTFAIQYLILTSAIGIVVVLHYV